MLGQFIPHPFILQCLNSTKKPICQRIPYISGTRDTKLVSCARHAYAWF